MPFDLWLPNYAQLYNIKKIAEIDFAFLTLCKYFLRVSALLKPDEKNKRSVNGQCSGPDYHHCGPKALIILRAQYGAAMSTSQQNIS